MVASCSPKQPVEELKVSVADSAISDTDLMILDWLATCYFAVASRTTLSRVIWLLPKKGRTSFQVRLLRKAQRDCLCAACQKKKMSDIL